MLTHGLSSLRMSFWVFVNSLKCGPGFDFTLFFVLALSFGVLFSPLPSVPLSLCFYFLLYSQSWFSLVHLLSVFTSCLSKMCTCVSVYNFYLGLSVFLLICLSLSVLLYIHSSLRCDPVTGLSRLLRNIHIFYYYNYQCLIDIQNLIHLFRTETTWMCSVSLTSYIISAAVRRMATWCLHN